MKSVNFDSDARLRFFQVWIIFVIFMSHIEVLVFNVARLEAFHLCLEQRSWDGGGDTLPLEETLKSNNNDNKLNKSYNEPD